MLYFAWQLLNLGAVVLLLLAVIRAAGLFNRQWGPVGSGVFFLVLLSTCQGHAPVAASTSQDVSGDTSTLSKGFYHLVIDDQLTYDISLIVAKNSVENPTGVVAQPGYSGLIAGHQWQPLGTGSYEFHQGQLTYIVPETLRWHLLGFPIFSETKVFKGTVALR